MQIAPWLSQPIRPSASLNDMRDRSPSMRRSPSMSSRRDSLDASFIDDPSEPSVEKAIAELPVEDRDDSFLPEEDRDLTPEEQIEELKAMLREGRIGIHAFDKLHTKAWAKVLENQGADSPTQAKLRYQNSRKLSAAGSAVDLVTAMGRKSRASRKSKELYREMVEAEHGYSEPPEVDAPKSGEASPKATGLNSPAGDA